jgi:hypothetical protein
MQVGGGDTNMRIIIMFFLGIFNLSAPLEVLYMRLVLWDVILPLPVNMKEREHGSLNVYSRVKLLMNVDCHSYPLAHTS